MVSFILNIYIKYIKFLLLKALTHRQSPPPAQWDSAAHVPLLRGLLQGTEPGPKLFSELFLELLLFLWWFPRSQWDKKAGNGLGGRSEEEPRGQEGPEQPGEGDTKSVPSSGCCAGHGILSHHSCSLGGLCVGDLGCSWRWFFGQSLLEVQIYGKRWVQQ